MKTQALGDTDITSFSKYDELVEYATKNFGDVVSSEEDLLQLLRAGKQTVPPAYSDEFIDSVADAFPAQAADDIAEETAQQLRTPDSSMTIFDTEPRLFAKDEAEFIEIAKEYAARHGLFDPKKIKPLLKARRTQGGIQLDTSKFAAEYGPLQLIDKEAVKDRVVRHYKGLAKKVDEKDPDTLIPVDEFRQRAIEEFGVAPGELDKAVAKSFKWQSDVAPAVREIPYKHAVKQKPEIEKILDDKYAEADLLEDIFDKKRVPLGRDGLLTNESIETIKKLKAARDVEAAGHQAIKAEVDAARLAKKEAAEQTAKAADDVAEEAATQVDEAVPPADTPDIPVDETPPPKEPEAPSPKEPPEDMPPETRAEKVADFLTSLPDFVGDGFYKIPLAKHFRAWFGADLKDATTEAGRAVAREIHRMEQEALRLARADVSDAEKAVSASKLLDVDTITKQVMEKNDKDFAAGMAEKLNADQAYEQAIEQVNNRSFAIIDALENTAPLPIELAGLAPIVDELRAGYDKILKVMQDAGVPVTSLYDAYVKYAHRRRRLPGLQKNFSRSPDIGTVGEASSPSQKQRADWARDVPGGRAVLDQMSVDPDISGFLQRNKIRSNKLTDAQLKKLRWITAERYGSGLVENFDIKQFNPDQHDVFDKQIRAMAALDPGYADEQLPLFGRDFLFDYFANLNDGYRASAIAERMQEVIAQGLVPRKYANESMQHADAESTLSAIKQWNPVARRRIVHHHSQATGSDELIRASERAVDEIRQEMQEKNLSFKFHTQDDLNEVEGILNSLGIEAKAPGLRPIDSLKVDPIFQEITQDGVTKTVFSGDVQITGSRLQAEEITKDFGVVKKTKNSDGEFAHSTKKANGDPNVVTVPLEDLPEELLGSLGKDRAALSYLNRYMIDTELADAAGRALQPFSDPESVSAVYDAYARLINVTKTGLTAQWPAFHIRNLASAMVQNEVQGILKDDTVAGGPMKQRYAPMYAASQITQGDAEVASYLRGIAEYKDFKGTDEELLEAFKDELFEVGVFDGKQGLHAEMVGESIDTLAEQRPGYGYDPDARAIGKAGGVLDKWLPVRSFNRMLGNVHKSAVDAAPANTTWTDAMWPLATKDGFTMRAPKEGLAPEIMNVNKDMYYPARFGRKFGGSVEYMVRTSPYLALRRRGFTADAAKAAVDKAQVDYSRLSSFERKYARLLMPFYCMPTDHEILTRDGWKNYTDLKLGEEVLAYDKDTDTSKWTPLLEVAEFDFDGDLMQWETSRKGKKINFQFTDNHRWPVEKKKMEYVGSEKGKSRYKQVGWDKSIIEAQDIVPGSSRIIGAAPLEDGDEGCVEMSARHAAILGWVVTDGYHRKRGGSHEMLIYQSPKKHLNEILELTGSQPRKPHPDTGVAPVNVTAEDKAEILKYYESPEDLPGLVTRLTRDAANAMLDAMDKAESCHTKASKGYFAQCEKTNPHIKEAYQILRQLNGDIANYAQKGIYVRKRNRYSWRKQNISRVPYKGKIWCPRTKYGTWVVRHNGNVAVTGNTFSRNMVPTVMENLATRPGGKMATLVKINNRSRNPQEQVPDHIADTLALDAGTREDGTKTFLTGFGLAHEDSLGLLHGPLRMDPYITFRSLLSRMGPFPKAPTELAFGRSTYMEGPQVGGRELGDLDPPIGRTLSNVKDMLTGSETKEAKPFGSSVLGESGGQMLEFIANNSPLSRWATSTRTLTDTRKSMLDKLLNLSTGLRITDVSPNTQDAILRQRIGQLIKDAGGRTFRRDYVPDYIKEELSPEELQELEELLDALQTVEKRFKTRRDLEKALEVDAGNQGQGTVAEAP